MIFIRVWRFITLVLASLSLSLSMAHLLELPQRMQFDQQLFMAPHSPVWTLSTEQVYETLST